MIIDGSSNNCNIGSNNDMYFYAYDSSGNAIINSDGTHNCLGRVVNLNQWNHIAVTKNGSSSYFFVNGILQGTDSSSSGSISGQSAPLEIGRMQGYGGYTNIYFDELRISKGIARWTSDFTVPTNPYLVPDQLIYTTNNTNYTLVLE